jgi:nitroreductase
MIGAFRDEEVKSILGIQEEPIYLIPIGKIKDALQT